MSDSAGIRRSSRRREKHRGPSFHVGDIVEIARVRGRTKGRLVSKLTDDASVKPRWLVAFDDESWPEEDMYESNFGSVLGKADLSKLVSAPPSTKSTGTSKKNKKQKKATLTIGKDSSSAAAGIKNGDSSRSASPSIVTASPVSTVSSKASPVAISSPEDTRANSNNKKNKKKRKVMSATATSPADEDNASNQPEEIFDSSVHNSSAHKTSAAAASRAARSLRRQAKLEAEQTKRQLYQPPAKKIKTKDSSDIVRIPMLTGTLILYRGPRRRAEFIYKK